MQFSPCRGGDNCTQDGTHCQGCGRSHEAIAGTREVIGALVQEAERMGYENFEDFVNFVAQKAKGKIMMSRA